VTSTGIEVESAIYPRRDLQITAGVSDRLVLIIQGVIVLSVVIAYEVIRRANVRFEQRKVAQALAEQGSLSKEGAPA
jgi:simple sugar transport system permease protein